MDRTSPRVAAACAALRPLPWQQLTHRMLVRRVLALEDGLAVGAPAAGYDPRVDPLLTALATVAWRTSTLDAVCRLLLEALDDWHLRDQCLDAELAWLLADGA